MCVFSLDSGLPVWTASSITKSAILPQTPGPHYHRSSVFIFILTLFHLFWVFIRKVTSVNDKRLSMKQVHYTITHSYHLAKIINSFMFGEYIDSVIWKKYQGLSNASRTTSSDKSPVTMTHHLKRQLTKGETCLMVSVSSPWPLDSVFEPEAWSWESVAGDVHLRVNRKNRCPQAAKDKACSWSPISFSR